ncbi:hypothetical protein L6164_026973 [Bauhinia variegata]|uniref:Uncharacterized protein n=1 Tax=Bauhinia variegata TaxID=167791 RepID=A0ACB9LT94_BAUVA|nr:hypothetical protein L6164_026973 [Bauhinia variegata]
MDGESGKKTQLEGLILSVSAATVLSLIHFHYKTVDGNPVPTIIFQDNPSLFRAFILSLNFSFFGSFTSLTLRHAYPRLSKCCMLLAVVSITTGFGIILFLTIPVCFSSARQYLRSSF